jgi:2-hydroxy-3-keto-5-methylthiopentenyl-1-phosphate phosphatase
MGQSKRFSSNLSIKGAMMAVPERLSEGILVSDFDGTMTKYDFYDLVCREFPDISAKGFWQQYEEGRITHFEALRSIFASIRIQEDRLLRIVQSMAIEPRLAEALSLLDKKGWKVIIASSGCDWYIKHLLKDIPVSVDIYANPGKFIPDEGLVMRLPVTSPFFSADIGINKMAVVRDALQKSACVAFAGDGRPDLAPALIVPPQRRFAKHLLAKQLREIGEAFRPFENWVEVAEYLVKGECRC